MATIVLHLLSLLCASSALTQTPRSSASPPVVRGIVRDATGGVLPGATVDLLTESGSQVVQATTSAADGTFQMTAAPGSYRLRVSLTGFEAVNRAVEANASSVTPPFLTVVLSLSAVEQRLTVNAEALGSALPPVSIGRRTIDTLPSESVSSGLSSILTLTSPSVAADSNGVFHPLGDHAESSFSIDGQPVSDQQSRIFSNQLSPDTIESIDVETGIPPAQYGDKTSLVAVVATRSGLGYRRATGAVRLGYGSFSTPTASLSVGKGTGRLGEFLEVDGTGSRRFLDTPEVQPLHAYGTVGNLFDRVDVEPSPATAFQVNVSAARSHFETPNTIDQERAGQDQRQRQSSFDVAPSFRRVASDRLVVEARAWVRRDTVQYDPSAALFSDQPATLAQHRTLTNAGGQATFTYAPQADQTIQGGGQYVSTWLDERFQTGLTDPAFNAPCAAAAGGPSADTTVREPDQCASAGLAPNPDFLSGLAPYDLTRGGALFSFDGAARIRQWAGWVEDALHAGPWSASAGVRVDIYHGLGRGVGVQPRLGASYRVARTSTVFHAGYGRIFLTPYNENLVLASSTGAGGLGGGVLGSVGGAPLEPARRNQYDAGVEQHFRHGLELVGDYFWKRTRGAYDFDVILNTPLTFPVQFQRSLIDGGSLRLMVPVTSSLRVEATVSHTRSRLFGPELGGLRFSASYAPVARPDHDEPFAATTRVEYHTTRLDGLWAALTWRVDSGLVAVSVPTYAAALALTGDEQAAMGLYCGDTFATPASPIRSCTSSTFGAMRIRIPAVGTENDDTNPPRIVPHQLVDIGLGIDAVRLGRVPLRLRVTVVNVFDTTALYNFLSTFAGTHFVTPRVLQVQLSVEF